MTTLAEAKAKAAATYNAAADVYDEPANSFWERFGRETIRRLAPAKGSRLLDVCCGSGASALPAAETVGPAGSVLGIDLAENLLARARAKAAERGLHNAQFRTGDMTDLRLPPSHFDAVVCVFGIFFVPDMAAAVRSLWSVVRPGGKLAVTTWGPRWFEPGSTAFWNSIREVRPDLHKGFNPWDRIVDPAALNEVLRKGGVEEAEVVADFGEHPIPWPDAWWAAVMGTGYRGTVDQLDPEARAYVRKANDAFIERSGVRAVEANVLYALATKR